MSVTIRKDQLQEVIKLIDGTDAQFFKETTKEGQQIFETATVRVALRRAVANTFQDEQNLSGDQKLERFMLAQKIWTSDDVELSPTEVTTVKNCVSKSYSIEVIGYLFNLLK